MTSSTCTLLRSSRCTDPEPALKLNIPAQAGVKLSADGAVAEVATGTKLLIKWTGALPSSTLSFPYSLDGGKSANEDNNIPNSVGASVGQVTWDLPLTLLKSTSFVIIASSSTDSNNFFATPPFTLVDGRPATEPKIVVQNPKGTTALTPGNEMQIQWTGGVEDGSVIIRMRSSSASSFDAMFSLPAEAIPNEGALTIRIPSSATTSSDYMVQITSASDPKNIGLSAKFSVSPGASCSKCGCDWINGFMPQDGQQCVMCKSSVLLSSSR
jgi:hypothetical protein